MSSTVALTVTFAYVVPYAGSDHVLEPLLPERFAGSAIGGTPAFTPGVAVLTTPARAAFILAVYLAVFTTAAGALMRRQDFA
jgi:hypothetical protein